MRNPFVPLSRASIAIISKDAPEAVKKGLRQHIETVVETTPLEGVYNEISNHPDIAIMPVGNKRLVVAPSVYEYYRESLEPLGFSLVKGDSEPGYNYPENISYNAAILGGNLVCYLKSLDRIVEDELSKKGLGFINVAQGYAKCSLAVIGESRAITSDVRIAERLIKTGADILLIEHGHIRLQGMNYGFIGGSVGLLSERELMITGSISNHPSKGIIKEFLNRYDIRLLQLSEETIIDIGTILTF